MPELNTLDQSSDAIHSKSARDHEKETASHDSDDEPMVYEAPRDYATNARQQRDCLIAEGADPGSVIFLSDVPRHVPQQEGESLSDWAKRYSETMNALIRRGVSILNDQCVGDVVSSGFTTVDGRHFDLGLRSGATKGEFREFSQWFSEVSAKGQTCNVPEKWLKFEK